MPELAGTAIAALITGIIIGWNAAQATGAHNEVRSSKAKIIRYRKARLRSGLLTACAAAIVIAALASLTHR